MGQKGDSTKLVILEAARKLFCAKGFKQVTMKDICIATELSRGGLYRYYGGTDEIFLEIVNEMLENQNDIVQTMINDGVNATEILDSILVIYSTEMMDVQNSMSLAIFEYFSTFKEEDMMTRQYLCSWDSWDRLLSYGIQRGEFNQVDKKSIFELIVFSYQGVRFYSHMMSIEQDTVDRLLGLIRDWIVRKKEVK